MARKKRVQVPKFVKDMKPAGKATLALGATGLVYAASYTTAKGIGNAFAPSTTQKVDEFIRYTDPGLLLQTGAIVGSSGLAIKFLDSDMGKRVVPNFFGKFKGEATIMKSAAMGLALGRLMTGLSVKDVGQRFQALFDANLPAAIAPTPGPYFNRPANISALNDVVSRPTNNTAPVVANNYYQSVYRPRLDAQLDYIKMMSRNNSNNVLNQTPPNNKKNGLPNSINPNAPNNNGNNGMPGNPI